MSTLSDLLAEHTHLPGGAVDHLQRVVGEWQLLADLSFADFLLWVAQTGAAPMVCVAQCRPTTASTAYSEDEVGSTVTDVDAPQVLRALDEGEVFRDEQTRWYKGVPLRMEAVPVTWRAQVTAVLSRSTNLAQPRFPSPLEIAYLDCADDLCQMICDGTFPMREELTAVHSSPRAGDGFIRLDPAGNVAYSSPNALSAYHRMGLSTDLAGRDLAEVTRSLVSDSFDAQEVASRLRSTLTGDSTLRMEIDARGATVLLRALPLHPRGEPTGAAVLVRDVTEVKRRDRALLSKDATIREIHHRVKNNLQTVAALLRLQGRRTDNEEARHALTESVRRVSSIALVHETLSMSVDEEVNLDEVVDRLVPIMADVSAAGSRVQVRREGGLGVLQAERATPLVMVLAELVQNALEHGFGPDDAGEVVITAKRSARWLDVLVHDNGSGLPEGFSIEHSKRLGLQIARTLVDSELGGSLGLHPASGGGTDAVLRVRLGRRPRLGPDVR
ncbi:sensor histidine kinase [Speluncibacter jeojiensis]|uniref:histidine kinase n=1 Tax=Speluncibacter jeojiensis TaxID=2710754 RepID=A0A9X4M248_9ACTN|nr:PAS domain-containing sensor histidine kinase [Corynebacteriales bacterium D3-21]